MDLGDAAEDAGAVTSSEKLLGARPAFSYACAWPPKGASAGVPGLQTL